MEHIESPLIYNAGIDAITLTIRQEALEREWLDDLWRTYEDEQTEQGQEQRNFAPRGYTGRQVGSIFHGSNGTHSLYIAKGAESDELAKAIRETRVICNVTRCDWQVTHKVNESATVYLSKMRRAIRRRLRAPSSQLPGKTTYYESPDGANSFYVYTGDREFTARHYCKGIKEPGSYPIDAVRDELQLMGKRALDSFNKYRQFGSSSLLALAQVKAHRCMFECDEPFTDAVRPIRAIKGKHKSSTERRIKWVQDAVIPALLNLGANDVDLVKLLQPLQDAELLKLANYNYSALKSRQNNRRP